MLFQCGWDMGENGNTCILDFLRTVDVDVSFRDYLKTLEWPCCEVNGDILLETLLLEILPRFPNLSYLILESNEMYSVR